MTFDVTNFIFRVTYSLFTCNIWLSLCIYQCYLSDVVTMKKVADKKIEHEVFCVMMHKESLVNDSESQMCLLI